MDDETDIKDKEALARKHIEKFLDLFRKTQKGMHCRWPKFVKEPLVNIKETPSGLAFQYIDKGLDKLEIVYNQEIDNPDLQYITPGIPRIKNTKHIAVFWARLLTILRIALRKLRRADELIEIQFYPEALVVLISSLEALIKDYHIGLSRYWFPTLRYGNLTNIEYPKIKKIYEMLEGASWYEEFLFVYSVRGGDPATALIGFLRGTDESIKKDAFKHLSYQNILKSNNERTIYHILKTFFDIDLYDYLKDADLKFLQSMFDIRHRIIHDYLAIEDVKPDDVARTRELIQKLIEALSNRADLSLTLDASELHD